MSEEFPHCRHETCCQCYAKRGTTEHNDDCMDARSRRAMNARNTGGRRLPAFWMRTLAANLAIGAALCEAFNQGHEQAQHEQIYSNHGYRTDQDWRPGCQRSAR